MSSSPTPEPLGPRWSWPGAVALVIGGSLGLGWAIALIITAIRPEPATSQGIGLLEALGQTLAGAVAAYLGYQVGTTKGRNTQEGSTRLPEADNRNRPTGSQRLPEADRPGPTDGTTPPADAGDR